MELIKENWTKREGEEFVAYLEKLAVPEKQNWTRKIINTNMPLLAIPTPKLKEIAKVISKGNYEGFLQLNLTKYYENVAINGFLLSEIKDFNKFRAYLMQYVKSVDNWANCDLLQFKVSKNNEEELFNLSRELFGSKEPFVRRIGVRIWFEYILTKRLDTIFNLINNKQEDEYYVNMCVAWFVSECFIKQREKTLQFLENNNLNKFTINKAISKCHDSYRVSGQDKVMLKKFKK